MTDDLEPRMRVLLEERGRVDARSVEALLDGIRALPRRRARPWIPAAAAVLVIALVGLVAFRPLGGIGGLPLPPDPAAFAGDPRLDACFAGAGEVEAAFEMPHARDYQRHLPRMLRSPELEVDEPGFVVVFAGDVRAGAVGPRPESGKYVCVLVGDTPNLYSGVDVTGLIAILPDVSGEPTTGAPSPTPTPSAAAVASSTVAPAPFWVADLASQLQCDGPVARLGGEVGQVSSFDPVATPEGALEVLLTPGVYATLPARGWQPAEVEGHFARHRYLVDDRLKAIAVSTDVLAGYPPDTGWDVVGVLACDASEFDPADGSTDGQSIWLDADGQPVRSDRLFSRRGPGHCGWEGITFLHFEDRLYLRDDKSMLADQTAGSFRLVDRLPSDAVDTGLHNPEWRLFTVADESSIYMQTIDDTVERWPRGSDDIGCA